MHAGSRANIWGVLAVGHLLAALLHSTLTLWFSAMVGSLALVPATAHAAATPSTGVGSWYGPGFHGERTASGTRFDQYAMTAAHPHLPFGTRLCVTNLENRKSAVVEVTDRQPRTTGRVIDVSYAAARALDMVERGTVRVQLQAERTCRVRKTKDRPA